MTLRIQGEINTAAKPRLPLRHPWFVSRQTWTYSVVNTSHHISRDVLSPPLPVGRKIANVHIATKTGGDRRTACVGPRPYEASRRSSGNPVEVAVLGAGQEVAPLVRRELADCALRLVGISDQDRFALPGDLYACAAFARL
jgi:hypothetical protein